MDRKKKKRQFGKAIEMELRQHRSVFAVYCILRAIVILCGIRQFFIGNYEQVFLCVLTLVLMLMPSILQLKMKIELPTTLEIIVLLFIFAAEIMGEIGAYYIRYENWDTMLHTLNGFLMAAIGFSLIDILDREERVKFDLSPVFMALVAFCFSMTVGVMWEFFEHFMDVWFGLDMQKDTIIYGISSVMLDPTGGNTPTAINGIREVIVNGRELGLGGYLDIGLYDTMFDLWVNFIGATVFSIIGYFYIKYRGEGKFARRFIPFLKKAEEDYLKIVEEEDAE